MFDMVRTILFVALLSACSTPADRQVERAPRGEAAGAPSAVPLVPDAVRPAPLPCDDAVPVYAGGVRRGVVRPEQAAAAGLTVVDLSDGWLPRVLAREPEIADDVLAAQRAMLLALARERFESGPEWDRARDDRYLELFGIFPTLSVIRARLLDEARHRCHDAIEDRALALLTKVDPWKSRGAQRVDRATAVALRLRLERAARLESVARIEDLETRSALRYSLRRLRELTTYLDAVAALKAHLRCDGLLVGRDEEGVIDERTSRALALYQRKHMLVSSWLDPPTRATLAGDSRELDLHTLLRALRERIVDATGLLEDGSAAGSSGLVAGRRIDTEAFVAVYARDPLADAAPDLIAGATDAAARALGWIDPESAARFFTDLQPETLEGLRVAVKLPPVPSYHRPHMDLRAVLDRGDVWYGYPYAPSGGRYGQPVERRPTLIIYARDGDRDIALARLPTTIGGWQPERLAPHTVALVYKESPVGPRMWRDLVVLPTWMPPASTPRRDLVRLRPNGAWAQKSDLFGPGYASAYGLVMLPHLRVDEREGKPDICTDEGVRTHGSVNYASILQGQSHGCHRLHNHLALRLAGFLLAHREHVRRGKIPLGYVDTFPWKGKTVRIELDSRGHLYELTPPVPVEVLPGRIRGRQHVRIDRPMPLPPEMAQKFTLEP